MLEIVLIPLGMAALAGAMLWSAWCALGEYQKLFLANPRLLMSLEVFAVAADIGALGYVAAVLALCGVWLLVLAAYVGIALIYSFFK